MRVYLSCVCVPAGVARCIVRSKDAPADFFAAFGRIVDISRELNIQVQPPQVVVIGCGNVRETHRESNRSVRVRRAALRCALR